MKLAADASGREHYRVDPVEAAIRIGCQEGEAAAFAQLPWKDLERYAMGLVSKRWQEVRRATRLSLRVCPHIEVYYKAWIPTHPAATSRGPLLPGPREALRALNALCSAIAREPVHAPYVRGLLRFEVLGRCSRQDSQVREMVSEYAVHEMVGPLRSGIIPFDPDVCRTRYRFSTTMEWRPA